MAEEADLHQLPIDLVAEKAFESRCLTLRAKMANGDEYLACFGHLGKCLADRLAIDSRLADLEDPHVLELTAGGSDPFPLQRVPSPRRCRGYGIRRFTGE